jgi:hypothetical protein
MTTLAKPIFSIRSRWTLKRVLSSLGLPVNARWPEASRRVVDLIIKARKHENEEEAKLLSMVKEFLKRNCYRTCSCGSVIRSPHRKCCLCVPKS